MQIKNGRLTGRKMRKGGGVCNAVCQSILPKESNQSLYPREMPNRAKAKNEGGSKDQEDGPTHKNRPQDEEKCSGLWSCYTSQARVK